MSSAPVGEPPPQPTCPAMKAPVVKKEKPKEEVRFFEYDGTCPKGKGYGGRAGGGEEEEDTRDRLIMAPPPYPDLGKDARGVFSKGYHFGLLKLDCKTKSTSGVEFASGGVSNLETGSVSGSLETTYKIKDYGLTFTEKWNTDNVLAAGVCMQDHLAKGLKLCFDTTFAPQTGSKTGVIKSEYKNELCALNCDLDLDTAGPLTKASAVVGYKGWLAGYQTGFDFKDNKITTNNFALGYSTSDFILHTNVDNGQDFGGSIFQKVSPNLDAAINLAWSANSNETQFGIGCKYDLDKNAAVRAKVNNASQIGLGYQQTIREVGTQVGRRYAQEGWLVAVEVDLFSCVGSSQSAAGTVRLQSGGVTITLSTLIDGKNFNQGGHKIGVALELQA